LGATPAKAGEPFDALGNKKRPGIEPDLF